MANSNRTTYFGPRVSFSTTKSDAGPVQVLIPSHASFSQQGRFLSAATTASKDSSSLFDGELSIASVEVLRAFLFYRSGNTVYEWLSTGTSV